MAMEEHPPPPLQQTEVGAGGRRTDKGGRRLEVYNEVLARLRDLARAGGAAEVPAEISSELWAHFHRRPARYALDVNVERAEDMVMHQRLLEEAHDPERRPALSVRVVQVSRLIDGDMDDDYSDPGMEMVASSHLPTQIVHPPPAFGSSFNLEALALEASESDAGSNNNTAIVSVHLVSRRTSQVAMWNLDF